jgi:hypothetical protein
MRSSAGVGITPPKVLATPKPASSVRIRTTFGAPLGGVTRAGQYGVDSCAVVAIFPPKGGSGAGSWRPSITRVAAGEPGGAVDCAAAAPAASSGTSRARQRTVRAITLASSGLHR